LVNKDYLLREPQKYDADIADFPPTRIRINPNAKPIILNPCERAESSSIAPEPFRLTDDTNAKLDRNSKPVPRNNGRCP
jgi:hypothetical protein